MPLTSTVYGAVHLRSPAQAGCPSFPQNNTPETQPPPEQVPAPRPQVAPEPMQVRLLLSQQPPPAQTLPWQHGWPGPPHAPQVLPLHARPEAVQ